MVDYFQHFPNRYYADVQIKHDRIGQFPQERSQLPGLKIIEVEKNINEEDKGPSPGQFFIPFSSDDESVTTSGLTCPVDPKDADKELNSILKKLTGSDDILKENGVASADWNHSNQSPVSELKTPGFFSMAFPDVFINGSGDITSNQLVTVPLDEWIQHIYYNGEGRVPKHPFLKFFLYNLSMRMKALNQGNFLVSQQLNDAHVSIEELI